MNILLDTNVLIDYLGRKDPFFPDAERIFAAGFFGDATLWTPAASIKDAFYILERYVGAERVQKSILELAKAIHFVSITEEDIIKAARLNWPDLEDCIVSICAEKAHADFIVTRDEKGFERSSIPVVTPAEWLETQAKLGISYASIDL